MRGPTTSARSGDALGECPPHRGGDFVDLLGLEMWAHRQAEHRVGKPFGQRIGAPALPQIGIGLLQMRRDRVVHQRADTLAIERLDQLGAAVGTNHIKVPYRLGPLWCARQAEPRNVGEPVVVARGNLAALLEHVLSGSTGGGGDAGGSGSGLKVGASVVLTDKDQLPSRALEPRAFDSLAMGEVVSVSEFAAEVKLKTSAKINNPSQWMAVPYMP